MNHYWIILLTAALFLNIAPGPDMIFLITQTLSRGKRIGTASMLGFGTGAMIHATFVALGISAIISTSMLAFHIIKYIGAAYLLYLGIKTLVSGGLNISLIESTETTGNDFLKTWLQAIVIDVTNPKVALFFIAFLPQFYREDGGPKVIQFLFLGLIIVLVGFLVESLIIILSDKIASLLMKKPIISKLIDKVFGSVLIGLGLKLVLEDKK